MNPYRAELQTNLGIIEFAERNIISVSEKIMTPLEKTWHEFRTRNFTQATALTIGFFGIFLIPVIAIIGDDEYILDKLQSNIEAERAAKGQSTVLAVDTSGLTVRSNNALPATLEQYEQAALEHLARLHHTYHSWAERNQELMGTVKLKLKVNSAGTVVRVEPVDSHVNNSSFIKTVVDDVLEWKFPQGGSEGTEITVPLLFIPKGMDPGMIAQWERKVRSGEPQPKQLTPQQAVARLPGSADLAKPTAPTMAAPAQAVQTARVTSVAATPLKAAPAVQESAKIAVTTAPPVPLQTIVRTNTPPVAVASSAYPRAAAKASPVVITNRQLAIRDNPRYSANSVREIGEATKLSIIESRGDWLKVKLAHGGLTGFVRKEYVTPLNG